MKTSPHYLLPVLALAALVPVARAEKEVTMRRLDVDGPRRASSIHQDGVNIEKEQVTFLGVETAPVGRTLGTQLGLARDTGLVVTRIADKSPAEAVLEEDDVLTKFDDQLLVNQQQLGVLVRGKKDGDEAKLTLVRRGKETTVRAKLAVHEVPKFAGNAFFPGVPGSFSLGAEGGLERLQGVPGIGPDHARDVLRMIGRERGHSLASPGMRIIARRDHGSTVLDLPNSNISYSDDDGAIEIKSADKQRTLTLKDAQGKVTFNGPINTEEERSRLPAEVKKRLEKLDTDTISFETDADFKPEVVPLPGEPTKTKISRELGRTVGRPLRSF